MDPELAALMSQLQQVSAPAEQGQTQQRPSADKLQDRVPINDRMLAEIILAIQQLKTRSSSSSNCNSNENNNKNIRSIFNLIYLTDGSGFVTREQLVREIVPEVNAGGNGNNGRCAVVDLPNLLGVDVGQVEVAVAKALESAEGKAAGLRRTDDGCELITDKFLQRVVDAAQQQLRSRAGSCRVADLARSFQLPSSFVADLLLRRIVLRGEEEQKTVGGGCFKKAAITASAPQFDSTRTVLYTNKCIASQCRALAAILLARSSLAAPSCSLNDIYQRHSGVLMETMRDQVVAQLAAAAATAADGNRHADEQTDDADERVMRVSVKGRFDYQSSSSPSSSSSPAAAASNASVASGKNSSGLFFHPASFEQQRSNAHHLTYTTQGWILLSELEGVSSPAVFLTSKYNACSGALAAAAAAADAGTAWSSSSSRGRGGGGAGRRKKPYTEAATTTKTSASTSENNGDINGSNPHFGHVLSQSFVSATLIRSAAQKLELCLFAQREGSVHDNDQQKKQSREQEQQQYLWHVESCVPAGILGQSSSMSSQKQQHLLQQDLSFLAARFIECCPSIADQCHLVDSSEHDVSSSSTKDSNDTTVSSASSASSSIPQVFFVLKLYFPTVIAPLVTATASDAAKTWPRPSFTESALAQTLSRAGPSATAASVKLQSEREYLRELIEGPKKCKKDLLSALTRHLLQQHQQQQRYHRAHEETDGEQKKRNEALALLLFSFFKSSIADIFLAVCLPHRCGGAAGGGGGGGRGGCAPSSAPYSSAKAAATALVSSGSMLTEQQQRQQLARVSDPRRFTEAAIERVFVSCQLLAKKFCCSSTATVNDDSSGSSSARRRLHRFLIVSAGTILIRWIVLNVLLGLGAIQSLPPDDVTLQEIMDERSLPGGGGGGGTAEKKALLKLSALLQLQTNGAHNQEGFPTFLETVHRMVSAGDVGNVSASMRQLGKKQERDTFKAEASNMLLMGGVPRAPLSASGEEHSSLRRNDNNDDDDENGDDDDDDQDNTIASRSKQGQLQRMQLDVVCFGAQVASWAISVLRYHVAEMTDDLWIGLFESHLVAMFFASSPAPLAMSQLVVPVLRDVSAPLFQSSLSSGDDTCKKLLEELLSLLDAPTECDCESIKRVAEACVAAVMATVKATTSKS